MKSCCYDFVGHTVANAGDYGFDKWCCVEPPAGITRISFVTRLGVSHSQGIRVNYGPSAMAFEKHPAPAFETYAPNQTAQACHSVK